MPGQSPRPINRYIFHDYETQNIDRPSNQGAGKPIEYAAIETTPDFEEIPNGRHHKIIKMLPSVVPGAGAFKVTGIDPVAANKVGITEFEFADWISNLYLRDERSVIIGYNNISFDDEITRHTLYRNLMAPYVHEFSRGNFRMDLYKVVQLAYAMNPSVLEWPENEDGTPSLKLENLSQANGIAHEDAHAATSDVEATIELARIISEKNPNLWNHCINLTDKKYVADVLFQSDMFFHIERFHGLENNLGKVLMSVTVNPEIGNQHICLDLNSPDVEALLSMDPAEINRLKFSKKEDLNEVDMDVPLHTIMVNKSPMIVKATEKNLEVYKDRFNLDIDQIKKNMELIKNNPDFKRILIDSVKSERTPPEDPSHKLYFMNGFPSRQTTKLLSDQHRKDEAGNPALLSGTIAELASKTDNPELYYDLALMAKWSNHYESLMLKPDMDRVEFVDWVDRLEKKVVHGVDGVYTLSDFENDRAQFWKENILDEEKTSVIRNLESVVDEQRALVDSLIKTAEEMRPKAENERKQRSDYRNLARKNGALEPAGPGF